MSYEIGRLIVSVKDFGAVGDGVTDDSAAIQAALAVGSTIIFPAATYVCKDISIGTHKTVLLNGSIIKAASGAGHVFKLSGFKPALYDGYFDDGNGYISASLTTAFIIVQNAQEPTVSRCMWVNQQVGLLIGGDANEVKKGLFTDLVFDTFALRGILLGKNANTCTFTNIRCYSGTVISGGVEIPKAGAIGFQNVGTSSTVAYGGHLLVNVDCEQSEYGFQFTDANLLNLQNCIGDSVSTSGFQVTGASDKIHFADCFAGTALIGFEIAGTSANIWISNPITVLQGVVPPWSGTGFYTSGSAYDISVKNTASVMVSGWKSDAFLIYADSGTTLSFTETDAQTVGSTASVAAASTVYLTTAGAQASEIMTIVAAKKGIILGITCQSNDVPGTGQTFTYNLRKNFASAGVSATTSGNASYGSSSIAKALFNAGDNIGLQLVTSAGANAAYHRAVILIAYFG